MSFTIGFREPKNVDLATGIMILHNLEVEILNNEYSKALALFCKWHRGFPDLLYLVFLISQILNKMTHET